MLALFYRSGRGGQALQTYQKARRQLMEEIGTEPGVELQELHRRILDNDADLASGGQAGAPQPTVEVHLPASLTPLVGREDVRLRLGALVAERRMVTVTGAAGSGKTRVAVEVARTAAPLSLTGCGSST